MDSEVTGIASVATVVVSSVVGWLTARVASKQKEKEDTERFRLDVRTETWSGLQEYAKLLVKRIEFLEDEVKRLGGEAAKAAALEVQVKMLREANEKCERRFDEQQKELDRLNALVEVLSSRRRQT